ncbi:MAG: lipopolysaccharide biosynthesis protein, partial [[Clostridium] symbiosum]
MAAKYVNKYRAMPVQAKASFWFLICAFLQRGISAITTPIFTRLMTTFEYGQYSVFTSWMSIAACFITLNIYGGVYVQGLVKFENQREQFASSFQGLNLSLTVIWLGIYILFSGKWNQLLGLTFGQGLLMLLLIWTTGVFQLWAQEQRVSFRYKALLLATLAYSLLAPILGVIFIKISLDKVTARIIGLAAASIAAYGWMFIVQCRKGKIFCSLELWKYALKLVIPLIPHYLSQMILNSSDRIMISRIVGDREAGIYSLAYSISLIMTMFNTSLLSTIEPWIYQRIREREVDKIKRVAYPSFVLIAMVNLLLIVFAPEIIGIFAPIEYYEAIWVIPPIAMSVFFMFACNGVQREHNKKLNNGLPI